MEIITGGVTAAKGFKAAAAAAEKPRPAATPEFYEEQRRPPKFAEVGAGPHRPF